MPTHTCLAVKTSGMLAVPFNFRLICGSFKRDDTGFVSKGNPSALSWRHLSACRGHRSTAVQAKDLTPLCEVWFSHDGMTNSFIHAVLRLFMTSLKHIIKPTSNQIVFGALMFVNRMAMIAGGEGKPLVLRHL